jgi:hypothetical protein
MLISLFNSKAAEAKVQQPKAIERKRKLFSFDLLFSNQNQLRLSGRKVLFELTNETREIK